MRTRKSPLAVALLSLFFLPSIAFGQDGPGFDTGDTAWILASSALVLFMTIPGLSLFYAGTGQRTERAVSTDALFRANRVDDRSLGACWL